MLVGAPSPCDGNEDEKIVISIRVIIEKKRLSSLLSLSLSSRPYTPFHFCVCSRNSYLDLFVRRRKKKLLQVVFLSRRLVAFER